MKNNDVIYMQRALELAQRVKGTTFPNPAVGAVIVHNGTITGEGATQPHGEDHAEIQAIKNAGSQTIGATLYVTLEPCCHQGKTPPCTEAIITAQIKRVCVAIKDPNPLVQGRGITQLQEHGIHVQCGILHDLAQRINEDFIFSIQQKRPWISLKLALSLDGKIADVTKQSQWITSEKARKYVHQLRSQHAAILVGKNTVLTDNPKLTVRHIKGPNPIRLVLASEIESIRQTGFLTNATDVQTIIVTHGTKETKQQLNESQCQLWSTGESDMITHFHKFCSMAYEAGITSIFIEGGGKVASFCMENGLVNRIYLFYGNKIFGGGTEGILFQSPLKCKQALTLADYDVISFDDTVLVSGKPNWGDRCLPEL